MPSISAVTKKRIAGALLIALGVLTPTTPLVAGRWSLAILGLPLIAMGIAEAYIIPLGVKPDDPVEFIAAYWQQGGHPSSRHDAGHESSHITACFGEPRGARHRIREICADCEHTHVIPQ